MGKETSALPARRLELAFQDLKPAYTEAQARAEASRCLYCHDAPCIAACPTAINIPEFIRKIDSGNYRGSARTILEANILGYSCALVCPVEVLCVGACVYNHEDRPPIQIGLLQRFATEFAYSRNIRFWKKGQSTGKRVALVGAGPASLACAHELTKLGHEAVCLEARKLPGGLNTTGCAPYKIRGEAALREVEYIQGIGFEVRLGVEVGKDISFAELERAYDAIFLGVGLGPDSKLGLPGEDLEGVFGACELIEKIKNEESVPELEGKKRAVVVGGGNTAIDVARELSRLGLKTTQLYRRGGHEMGAYQHEQDYARKEGVEFRFETQPTAYLGEDGHVTKVECVTMKWTADKTGKPVPLPGSEHEIPADVVAIATGQEKLVRELRKVDGLVIMPDGRVRVDPATGRTGNPKYYSGGDCANGGKEVVNAAAEGKKAAKAIHAALGGK
ncbi:MAG TPA: FAD-dependent oxidoreductase [Planctomycetota bacterium]|nr:FAD-dependent oxidoreductase [Planctomycetota bacterium]